MDDGNIVKLYVPLEGVGAAIGDDDVSSSFQTRSFEVCIRNFKPNRVLRLACKELFGEWLVQRRLACVGAHALFAVRFRCKCPIAQLQAKRTALSRTLCCIWHASSILTRHAWVIISTHFGICFYFPSKLCMRNPEGILDCMASMKAG